MVAVEAQRRVTRGLIISLTQHETIFSYLPFCKLINKLLGLWLLNVSLLFRVLVDQEKGRACYKVRCASTDNLALPQKIYLAKV